MRIEDIEKGILGLPQEQLMQFRAWYDQFDTENWDAQIKQDATDGKLDGIAELALAEYKAGKATKL